MSIHPGTLRGSSTDRKVEKVESLSFELLANQEYRTDVDLT